MATISRKLLATSLLLAVAAFSTTTISTPYYYETQHFSGLECQSGSRYTDWGIPLGYLPKGAVNRDEEQVSVAICPISIPQSGSYTINTVVFATNSASTGFVECILGERDLLSGARLRDDWAKIYVASGSSGLMSWYGVEHLASGSQFSVTCVLKPGQGVGSNSVSGA